MKTTFLQSANSKIRYLALLMVFTLLAVTQTRAAEVTLTLSDATTDTWTNQGASGGGTAIAMCDKTVTGITLNGTSGYCDIGNSYTRVYSNSTFTVESSVGNITKIVINARYKSSSGSIKDSNNSSRSLTSSFTNYTWNYSSGVSSMTFTSTSQNYIKSITVTYTAPSGYSITYHCNDATSGCPSNASSQTALPSPLPTPTRTGCTFAGWYTNEGLTTAATAGATLSANADLYAKWTCDITLNRNGVVDATHTGVTIGTTLASLQGDGAQGGCSAWEFIGWSKTQRAAQNNTTTMTLITEVDGVGPYYAVYRHTESGGGSSSETFTFSDIADAKSWANGTAYTEVTLGDVTIEAAGGGNNGKWYTSSGGSWRMYSGGTVNITSSAGDITEVTSTPSCTFTISDGAASFSPSARTDFTEIVVTYEGGDTYYYSTTATCCQNLGAINGSLTVTFLTLGIVCKHPLLSLNRKVRKIRPAKRC